jgi:hypothetical protein
MDARINRAFARTTYKKNLFKHFTRFTFLGFDIIQVAQALL